MLDAKEIHKSYGKLSVLKGVSISLNSGEVVSLVGSSGAGKSTLLQILGTLDNMDSGELLFEGVDVAKMSKKQKAAFRNEELGFVFQFHHLLPEFTAMENVCIPGFIHGTVQEELEERGNMLLTRLGLGERLDHKPSALSGGEQQRVAVARALINKPKLILADEPTGNLDSQNSRDLYDMMYELAKTTGTTILLATHDMELANKTDRTLRIEDGLIQN
ncbi:MAG: ABC transporter ATP-binding protein [Bacteroidota bacterium]